jgi:leucyl-tRNA synthetase
MRCIGIKDDNEIQKFVDPQYWISYFPLQAKQDLEMMGLKVSYYEVCF